MNIKSSNVIVDAVNAVLLKRGFRRHGKTWTYDALDTVIVVNLDRGFSGHLLVSGIVLKAAEEETKPAHKMNHYDSHIHLSAQVCVPEWRRISYNDTPLFRLFDPSTPIDNGTRADDITQFMTEHFLPFLDRCQTIDDLKGLYKSGDLSNAGVQGVAQLALKGE